MTDLIKPHVDNTEASGSWILGVSLGSLRGLRLENVEDSSDTFEMTLPSGSVYIQRYLSPWARTILASLITNIPDTLVGIRLDTSTGTQYCSTAASG